MINIYVYVTTRFTDIFTKWRHNFINETCNVNHLNYDESTFEHKSNESSLMS